MTRRLEDSRYALIAMIVIGLCVAVWLLKGNTELAAWGIVGYLIKLVVLTWCVCFLLLFPLVQLFDYLLDRVGIRRWRFRNIRQLDQLTPEEWLALSYGQRIEGVKVFLRREYPKNYPQYEWPVFALVEDATEAQLLRWREEGAKPYQPVVSAMLLAVVEVGHKGECEGYMEEALRAAEIAKRKLGT